MANGKVNSDIDAFREAALHCPLPPAVELIGEKWAFLILRGALNGLQHFEEFQSTLGIARNILSNRLGRLVEHGILKRQADAADRRKIVYRLSDKGKALLPVMIALRQWGERWVSGMPSNPVLVDRITRLPVEQIAVRAADGRPLTIGDLDWVDRSDVAVGEKAA